MKTVALFFTCLLLSSVFAASVPTTISPERKLLDEIVDAGNKKLPQTALEAAEKLEKMTKDSAEKGLYVRAIAEKIISKAHILGKNPRDKVK
ncbi:MAG: hypothetical protein WCP55_07710, partial [Lentisphaerota bacterium]